VTVLQELPPPKLRIYTSPKRDTCPVHCDPEFKILTTLRELYRSHSSLLCNVRNLPSYGQIMKLSDSYTRGKLRFINQRENEETNNWNYIILIKILFNNTISTAYVIHHMIANVELENMRKEAAVATQVGKELPASYGTRRFIIVFTRTRHWFLS